METFATPRLRASRLVQDDLADLVDLHLDEEVSHFLGGVRTPAATAEYLAANLRHWAEHGIGLWALRTKDGTFIGRAGLRYLDLAGVQEMQIGYTLARSAWGQGFASEIAAALVVIWEARDADPSLVAVVMKGNVASERVLLKAGLSYERDAVSHDELCSVFRRTR